MSQRLTVWNAQTSSSAREGTGKRAAKMLTSERPIAQMLAPAARVIAVFPMIAILAAFLLVPVARAESDGLPEGPPQKIDPAKIVIVPGIEETCGMMRFDPDTLRLHQESIRKEKKAQLDPSINPQPGSYSLLSYLNYNASERDQGSCGNCWVWAGTACLEISLSYLYGIYDRLSVQLFNSCWEPADMDFACCGGGLGDFTSWYNEYGYCIPWTNTNGRFQDSARTCASGSSAVSCALIGKNPRYWINSCSTSYITTGGVSQETAIANIKNVLNQGKAVVLTCAFPTQADADIFNSFWSTYTENAYMTNFLDFANGHTWNNGEAHDALCYGYYEDGATRVWLVLNSWGTANGKRPHGTFLVDMNMNYSSYYINSGNYYMIYWGVLDADFNTLPAISNGSRFDYDDDDHSDPAIFRPRTGMWAIRPSTESPTNFYFGTAGDIPFSWGRSGFRSDPAIFRPSVGLWSVRDVTRVNFGGRGDIPVPADYPYDLGDNLDIAVFSPSDGLWSIRGRTRFYFGTSGDIPLPRQWIPDAEGYREQECAPAIFRPSTGLWSVRGVTSFYFGGPYDIPVPDTYSSGSRPADAAIFRPATGLWSIRRLTRFYLGDWHDKPVPADFEANGHPNGAIFRGSTGLWSWRYYYWGNYITTRFYFGSRGDIPITR